MRGNYVVSDVAIYLRKSRGDGLNVLDKHRTELITLCGTNGWRPTIYEEISSGDSIEFRPEMQRLLKDVSNELYDAVVVVDYDRLGRGDAVEQAMIKRALSETKTLLVTPTKIYDMNKESDDMMSDVEGFFARMEYRQIKKRLARGKIRGAKAGNWVAGPAPFPYKYDALTKRLVPNHDYLPTFHWMVNEVLSGRSLSSVVNELNDTGKRTPTGAMWSHVTVKRILTSSAILGTITFGKTSGNGNNKKRNKPIIVVNIDNWITVENAHEAVIDMPTYTLIQTALARQAAIPRHSRTSRSILSGIVRCGRCDYFMTVASRRSNDQGYLKRCQKTIDGGTVTCGMRSSKVNDILNKIYDELSTYESSLKSTELMEVNNEQLLDELKLKKSQQDKLKSILGRVHEMFNMGDTKREYYEIRSSKLQKEINELEIDILILSRRIQFADNFSQSVRLDKVIALKGIWNSGDTVELNIRLKELIERVVYTKYENEITLKFLWR